MLPIPMPRFVVIELLVSELWPFEVAITGNRQTDRQHEYNYPIALHMHESQLLEIPVSDNIRYGFSRRPGNTKH